MQKILSGNHGATIALINEHFAKGWSVVPGTIVLASLEWRPSPNVDRDQTTQFEKFLTVVIEKVDEKSD